MATPSERTIHTQRDKSVEDSMSDKGMAEPHDLLKRNERGKKEGVSAKRGGNADRITMVVSQSTRENVACFGISTRGFESARPLCARCRAQPSECGESRPARRRLALLLPSLSFRVIGPNIIRHAFLIYDLRTPQNLLYCKGKDFIDGLYHMWFCHLFLFRYSRLSAEARGRAKGAGRCLLLA